MQAMNAADLIAFLRQHPKTCGALGIESTHEGHAGKDFDPTAYLIMYVDIRQSGSDTKTFTEWLTGAATLKADELRISVVMLPHGWFRAFRGDMAFEEMTRLHATLAAIEASL